MKKLLLIILAAFAICDCMSANRYLVLWMHDGTSASFELSKTPEITFDATDMFVRCGGGEIAYPLSEVLGYTYSSQASSAVRIDFTKENLEGFISDGALSLSHVDEGTTIEVYDLSGIRLLSHKAICSGSCEIPFNYGSSKVFIVVINGKSFKVRKK